MPRIALTTRRPARRGFTITELMISVVLVLLLTLAVGLIFRTTSETINKGSATGEAVRNLDGIRTALAIDMTGTDTIDYDEFTDTGGILPNSEQVVLMFSSIMMPTWENQEDYDADPRPAVSGDSSVYYNWVSDALTIDLNGDGAETGSEATILNVLEAQGRRAFRTDQITFGVRGDFESQTSGGGSANFTSGLKAKYALNYYGHLRVFNNNYTLIDVSNGYGVPGMPFSGTLPSSGNYPTGRDVNVNNRFADQFVLGRMSLLFVEPNAEISGSTALAHQREYIAAPDGSSVPFYRRNWASPTDTTSGRQVGPFTAGSRAFWYTGSGNTTSDYVEQGSSFSVSNARVDLLGTSMAEMRERLRFAVESENTTTGRSGGRFPFRASDQYGDSSYAQPGTRKPRDNIDGNIDSSAWWEAWLWTDNARLWINPYGQQPFDSRSMGQRYHLLSPGIRQFVVEYAGDYYEQDAAGNIADVNGNGTFIEPDGQVDFLFDTTGRRHVRFYGFPRDADGDGDVELRQNGATSGPFNSPDVLPLKDMANYGAPADPIVFPHEKIVPLTMGGPTQVPQLTNYGTTVANSPQPRESRYVCAWSPDELEGNFAAPFDFPLGPKLLRFVVEAVDAGGELEAPQRAEYVFRVPD